MTELPGMPEDEETQLAEVRAVRDDLLFASDYTQAADDPTGNAAEWATYRQTSPTRRHDRTNRRRARRR